MISIILLSLAILILVLTDAMLFKKVVDLEGVVDSHWKAIQRETEMLRFEMKGKDYYDDPSYREDGE